MAVGFKRSFRYLQSSRHITRKMAFWTKIIAHLSHPTTCVLVLFRLQHVKPWNGKYRTVSNQTGNARI
jgi:hypothetical protein